MEDLRIQDALSNGERFRLIPIARLSELKLQVDAFKSEEALNGFQEWIVNDLYSLAPPQSDFTIQSILLVAIPHPAYANVEFKHNGKLYKTMSLVMSDFHLTKKAILEYLEPRGFRLAPADKLPFKRLAAHCGLSMYGRNNVTYIEGMGSYFSYVAFYTDIPCHGDSWEELRAARICDKCDICRKSCPTGAIRETRFLIDNERCLSCLNERAEAFPEWLPLSVHHTVYDCLKCQIPCPMNKAREGEVIGPIRFNETETALLLSRGPFDSASFSFMERAQLLGFHQWLDAIPKNLKALFEQRDRRFTEAI